MPCMLYSTMFSRDPQASVILAGGRCIGRHTHGERERARERGGRREKESRKRETVPVCVRVYRRTPALAYTYLH